MQAAARSGALITASYALEQNRDVAVVPGPIDDQCYAGSNALLSHGAVPIIDADSLLGMYDITASATAPDVWGRLSQQQQAIVRILAEPQIFDDLLALSHTDASTLQKLLLSLNQAALLRKTTQDFGSAVNNTLYLASQSSARHRLLTQAKIPFLVVPTGVVEEEAEVSGSVHEQVCALADYKHSGIDVAAVTALHQPDKARPLFFLSADTLIAGVNNGALYGKPRNREHAAKMLGEIAQQEIDVVTGMALSVWQYSSTTHRWENMHNETWHAGARARFSIEDDMIDEYFAACPFAMFACGATVVEEIGIRGFSDLNGSYSGALGIDIYGLYQRLKKHGFWHY